MKKVILAPDSFKGTMSSMEICDIMETAIREVEPGCRVIKLPVADGGEGTVAAMVSASAGESLEAVRASAEETRGACKR